MKSPALRLILLTSVLSLNVPMFAQSETVIAIPASPGSAASGTMVAEPVPANDANGRQNRMRQRNENGNGNNSGGPNGNRPNFNPAEMQARVMDAMREQMGVKEDAEWAIISERITAINELRGGQFGGIVSMFMGGANARVAGGAGGPGGARFGSAMRANPEQDALRSAISDNLPDAEITARLTKLRESRKQHETKLDEARENLRAVLTVRQEAVAVMMGYLN